MIYVLAAVFSFAFLSAVPFFRAMKMRLENVGKIFSFSSPDVIETCLKIQVPAKKAAKTHFS